jgi:hypothetical protein
MKTKRLGKKKPLKSFCQVLTSTERNVRLDTWQLTPADLKMKCADAWSVKKLTLHGGKQEGVDLIVVDNGCLQITLSPTRGMGVLRVEGRDVRLGWDSPVREVVHPQFINLQSRSGLGWLEGFNEWMVRCGLENCGGPGRDQFRTNTGALAEMDLTLHGKICNIPASHVEVVIDREPSPRIRVRGRVEERMFYGPKLELWTELSLEPGARVFRIEDVITNHGSNEQEFQLLYHVNFGPPLLEAGAQFIGPIRQVTPLNEIAAQGMRGYAEYAGPTPGFVEQVYCLHPLADGLGRTILMLQNAAADRAASLTYSVAELPFVSLWKSTAAEADGYVTGIEPGTGFPNNRRIERQSGRVPRLGAGQSRRFAIDYGVHVGSQAVAQVRERIGRIQARRTTKVGLRG